MTRRQAWLTIHRIAHHPALNFTAGVILLITGLLESLAAIFEDLLQIPLGAHHGIAVFGFLQMVKCLPDMMKGMHFVDDGEFARVPSAAAANLADRSTGAA